ncbi:hypothetical protein Ancab_025544 [Ancistrocladus abbreviatus]
MSSEMKLSSTRNCRQRNGILDCLYTFISLGHGYNRFEWDVFPRKKERLDVACILIDMENTEFIAQVVPILVDSKVFNIWVIEELIGGSIFNHVKVVTSGNLASNSGGLSSGTKKHGIEGSGKSVTSAMNSEEPAQFNEEVRRVASLDRLSVTLDIEGADLRKGTEECVGLENLINANSSLYSGDTTSRDVYPDPCFGEMGLFAGNRGHVSETKELSVGQEGGVEDAVGPEVGCVKEVVEDEGGLVAQRSSSHGLGRFGIFLSLLSRPLLSLMPLMVATHVQEGLISAVKRISRTRLPQSKKGARINKGNRRKRRSAFSERGAREHNGKGKLPA